MASKDKLDAPAQPVKSGVGDEVELYGLTEQEREEIEEEANRAVQKELKDKAKKAYKTLAMARKRAELNVDPNEEKVVIHLNLAGHSDSITVNGIKYRHGETYTVPRSLANFLQEKEARGWQHEEEIGGANRDLYRKPREMSIGSKDLGTPNATLLRG